LGKKEQRLSSQNQGYIKMKTLLSLLLLATSTVALAEKQPTVVINNTPPAPVAHHVVAAQQLNTPLAVLSQQIQDLSAAEARRDSVEQMLIQSLSEKVNGDGQRIDKLESEAATIETVGALSLTLLLAFAGWSISVSSDRHKENRQTNQAISTAIQHLSTSVAVMESKMCVKTE
jgi:hypothetical protein